MGDGFAARPATNRLSLRRINAEPGPRLPRPNTKVRLWKTTGGADYG